MRVSLRWLRTMVDVTADIAELCSHLDMTGTGVEAVETSGHDLEGVVVGQIITKELLPDSDHLWLTQVSVGAANLDADGEPAALQIVCGAQNFQAGDKVAVALVGTTLPNGAQIKKTKLRGVESCGMNCSSLELGLGEDHDGILILPTDAPLGLGLSTYLDLSDTILDLEITPNRTDCMGMFGIAREVAAIYGLDYRLPELSELVGINPGIGGPAAAAVSVAVDDPLRCPRYTARLIRGIKVGPSPDWLAQRIIAAGARPVNNVVDVTNYIMFELGQPLHAFDYDCLAKDAEGRAGIVVRAAQPGERFTTLDGIERVLDPDVTCIVDGNADGGRGQAIALAGVMGGLSSEVTEETVNVLLESATFSPAHTSRTSRRLQLFSESAARYERQVDDATCDAFSARAADLIAALCGGEVAEGVVDCYPAPRQAPVAPFDVRRFQTFIGAEIPAAEIRRILGSLGCEVSGDDQNMTVQTPSYRPDLLREVDLYEEALRIWGMDNVEPTLPGGRGRIGARTEFQLKSDRLGEIIRAAGVNETLTYSIVPKTDADDIRMGFANNEQVVELINPMSPDMSVLRRTVIPGLLRSVAYNINHGNADIRLYEMGTVYFASEGHKLPRERQMLAVVMAGLSQEGSWDRLTQPVDFFDAKGILETIGYELNISKLRFKPLPADQAPWLSPGRAASVLAGSSSLGWLGEIHPRVAAAFDVEVPVVALELEYPLLLKASRGIKTFQAIPQFPAIQRDLAVVVDTSVNAEQVSQVLRSAGSPLLAELRLFDVFEDADKIGAGKKSLAYSISYRSPERTLTSEEVDAVHQKVIGKLRGALGAEIRS